MSDASQGPGWWLASDGKWYPPSAASGPAVLPAQPGIAVAPGYPGAPVGPAGYVPQAGPPAYGPAPAPGGPAGPGGVPPGYAPPFNPGYGYPGGGVPYAFAPPVRTNGLAIASLICSLVWFFWLGSILGIVFGLIARGQIKRSKGQEQGSGLATAGLIIGIIGIVGTAIWLIVFFAFVNHVSHEICNQQGSNCTFNNSGFGNT